MPGLLVMGVGDWRGRSYHFQDDEGESHRLTSDGGSAHAGVHGVQGESMAALIHCPEDSQGEHEGGHTPGHPCTQLKGALLSYLSRRSSAPGGSGLLGRAAVGVAAAGVRPLGHCALGSYRPHYVPTYQQNTCNKRPESSEKIVLSHNVFFVAVEALIYDSILHIM